MSAFNDGRCASCGRRMGWQGELKDKPACPKCGHKPTQKEIAELLETEKELEKARKEMFGDDS